MGSLSMVSVLAVVCYVCAAPLHNYDVQHQVCGDKLADMLALICGDRGGYNHALIPVGYIKVRQVHRLRRGIVEECCHQPCHPRVLELYCRGEATEPPFNNIQIRKRSDIGSESMEQSTESTTTYISPKPELISTNTIDTKTTSKNSVTNPMKEGENNYKVINLLTSAEHSSNKHSTKALVTKSTPNDTMEVFFPNSNIPPLRHHKNHHHHNRRKFYSHKSMSKTKRDKNYHSGSTKTFEIGTVKPYFAGRAFASYRSYTHLS